MNFEHVFRSVTFGASLIPSPLQVFNKCYTFWRLPILEKIDLLLQITFSRGIWVILTLNVLANNPTNFARPLCCYKNYPKPVKSLSFCKLRPVGEISEKHCSRKSLKISKKWSIGPYNGLNWSLNIFNFQLLETCHWIITKNWARSDWKQWKSSFFWDLSRAWPQTWAMTSNWSSRAKKHIFSFFAYFPDSLMSKFVTGATMGHFWGDAYKIL